MSIKDLIQQIEKEADSEITKLNEELEKAVYKIQKEYDEKRKRKTEELSKRTDENIAKIKQRADTFANMEIRNHLLTEKRALLQEVFEKIVATLSESDSYVKILVALLKIAKKEFKEGTVVPAKGKEDLTKKALHEANADFKLSSRAADITGGFIFKSGDIEIDFSFESILEKELWGDLEIKLSQLLF